MRWPKIRPRPAGPEVLPVLATPPDEQALAPQVVDQRVLGEVRQQEPIHLLLPDGGRTFIHALVCVGVWFGRMPIDVRTAHSVGEPLAVADEQAEHARAAAL